MSDRRRLLVETLNYYMYGPETLTVGELADRIMGLDEGPLVEVEAWKRKVEEMREKAQPKRRGRT